MLGSDGTVYPFGTAGVLGSAQGIGTAAAMAPTPDALGYWVASTTGTVQPFGDAHSLPLGAQVHSGSSVVTIAPTHDAKGFWLATDAGQIIAAGDATDFGSPQEQGIHLTGLIVDMVTAPDGRGYWLLGSDGGVFTYGDASFFGSTGGLALNAPVVAMAPTSDGAGYWLVASDGGIFSFGDASFHGSTGQVNPAKPPGGTNSVVAQLARPINGIVVTSLGDGYWMVASDGGVFAFGDAGFVGSLGAHAVPAPIVGFAKGPVVAPGPYTVTLGVPQTVVAAAPPIVPDGEYFTFVCNGANYGLVSGAYPSTTGTTAGTSVYTGEDHNFILPDPLATGQTLTPAEATSGLAPGPATYDSSGVWMYAVYQSSDGILHGYYHAEQPYPKGQPASYPHQSIAYAESTDCGKTWTLPNYPNNQIITGSTAVANNQAGNDSLYVIGDYLYLFYQENGVQALARSAIADAGRPGTWLKWYCDPTGSCSFTQPGLGGLATSSNPGGPQPTSTGRFFNTFVSYNDYLGEYISTDNILTNSLVDFKISTDAINWNELGPHAAMPPPPSGWTYWYGSIIALDGSSSSTAVTGQSFWVYYTLEDPTNATAARSLYRIEVTLQHA